MAGRNHHVQITVDASCPTCPNTTADQPASKSAAQSTPQPASDLHDWASAVDVNLKGCDSKPCQSRPAPKHRVQPQHQHQQQGDQRQRQQQKSTRSGGGSIARSLSSSKPPSMGRRHRLLDVRIHPIKCLFPLPTASDVCSITCCIL